MNTARPTADATTRRTAAMEFNSAWGVTLPADLASLPAPAPFCETIRGLVTREVNEPELFKLYFG